MKKLSQYTISLLELIQTVNNNYRHIVEYEQLERLIGHLNVSVWWNQEEIDYVEVVCKTTHNAHYDYKYMLGKEYQNPDNHVNVVLQAQMELIEQ